MSTAVAILVGTGFGLFLWLYTRTTRHQPALSVLGLAAVTIVVVTTLTWTTGFLLGAATAALATAVVWTHHKSPTMARRNHRGNRV